MSSETSSENNINYHDTNGKKIMSEIKHSKKESTDTDFYFDMVANKEKIVVKSPQHSESSDIKISSSSSSTTKSSSSKSSSSKSNSSKSSIKKPNVETFNFGQQQKSHEIPQFNIPSNTIPNTNNNNIATNISSIPIIGKTLPAMEPTVNVATLSPQEIRIKKIELLRRLSEIKTKGYNLTKDYDFNSSIEEMEYEYDLLKSFADKRNGVKLYRSLILNGISLTEMGNKYYDPFSFKLDGWSEHMSVEIDGWDDVLEELYEKYKTSGGGWPAELKLALLIIGSGAGYHFTKANLGGLPPGMGAGSVLGNMMSNKQKPSQFMSAQEINLEQQKKMMKERDTMLKQKQRDNLMKNTQSNSDNDIPQQAFNLGNLFNNMQQPVNNMQQPVNNMQQPVNNMQQPFNNMQQQPFNNMQQQPVNNMQQPFNNMQQQPVNNMQQQFNNMQQQPVNNMQQQFNIQHPIKNVSHQVPAMNGQFTIPSIASKGNGRDIPDIRAPDNVAEILSRIKNIQASANINTTETQEENSSNNDRLLSDATISTSDPMKKRGRKPAKAPLITIRT